MFSLMYRGRAVVEERAGECSNQYHAKREASEVGRVRVKTKARASEKASQ